MLRLFLSSNNVAVHRFVRLQVVIKSVLIATTVLACVIDCDCRDKPSWRGHSCDTDDNQRSIGVVITRNRSLGALDHQRRDLHPIKFIIPLGRSGHNPLSVLIQGPKHSGIDIDVFLEPLMQEIETLWKEGIDIFDG